MKYLFLLLTLGCLAQEKRSNTTVDIVYDTENNYTFEVPESPYFVKEKTLQIYPGEEINIEVELKGDTIATMKVVQNINYPDRTINIHFFQEAEDRNKTQMMLVVKNPFPKKLLYDALIFLPASEKWTSTSILPIQPKLVNYEMWPDVIATIVLENWRFIEY